MSDISEKIEAYHDKQIGLDELTQFMVGFEFKVPEHIENAPDDPNALIPFIEDQSYEQDDTWDEVNALFNLGWLSENDYNHIHQAVYDAHSGDGPEEKSGTRAGALLAWVRRHQRKFQDQLNAALQSRNPRALARAQQGLAAWTKYRAQVEKVLSNPNMGFKSLADDGEYLPELFDLALINLKAEYESDDELHELSSRVMGLSADALGGDQRALSVLPDLQEELLGRLVPVAVGKSETSEEYAQTMKSLREGLGFNDLMFRYGPDKAAELWREFHVNQSGDEIEKSQPGLLQLLNHQTQLLQLMFEKLQTPAVVTSNLVVDVGLLASAIREAVSQTINVQVPEQTPANIQVNVDMTPIADAIKSMPVPNVNVHPTITLPATKTEVMEVKLHRDKDEKLDGAVSTKTTTFEE